FLSLSRSSVRRASSWRSVRSRLKCSGRLADPDITIVYAVRGGRASHEEVSQKQSGHPKMPAKLPNKSYVPVASGGWLRLRCALLLDFLDLVHQIVGLLLQVGALAGAFHRVSLAAIEQVQISHGVVVVGAQR